jgi:hypothetical protein
VSRGFSNALYASSYALLLSACSGDDSGIALRADDVWPERQSEPPGLTLDEWARACAIAAGCAEPALNADDALFRATLTTACVEEPVASEAAAIPLRSIGSALPWNANERWSFFAREALRTGGDCSGVRRILTDSPPRLRCRESGCDWADGPPPLIRCQGDVATLLTREGPYERNCAAAFTRCDPGAVTGCSDRVPKTCERRGKAHCDGDVLLGCSQDNLVTFADCARHPSGRCAPLDGGTACVYPDRGNCTTADQHCVGTVMELCLQGDLVAVDCLELGFAGCSETAAGPHCTLLQ